IQARSQGKFHADMPDLVLEVLIAVFSKAFDGLIQDRLGLFPATLTLQFRNLCQCRLPGLASFQFLTRKFGATFCVAVLDVKRCACADRDQPNNGRRQARANLRRLRSSMARAFASTAVNSAARSRCATES